MLNKKLEVRKSEVILATFTATIDGSSPGNAGISYILLTLSDASPAANRPAFTGRVFQNGILKVNLIQVWSLSTNELHSFKENLNTSLQHVET